MSEFLSALVLEPAEPSNPSSRRFFLIAALFLLTIGTGLRIYHLGGRSLWSDEALTANISRGTWYDGAFTGHFSRGSLKEVLEQTRMWGSYPVTYPWILYLVEKVGDGPVAVRAVSALASILAVLMMLVMVRVKVSSSAALFSAAILAVSTTQIRYAQEVREYSLSVVFASILIFCFLQWESASSRRRHPVLLYAALFLAPFIQYGLVLLALGILTTIGLLLLLSRSTCFRLSHAVIAAGSFGTGGLFSLFLTLRYQLGIRQSQGYLAANYFDSKTTSLLSFLASNSYGLVRFLLPGRVVGLCFVIAAFIFCFDRARHRKCDPVAVLTFTSVLITVGASLVRAYPYGGIRQCLFLAPVLALFAGVSFGDLLEWLTSSHRQVAVVGVTALILLCGGRGILKSSPYREVEDIRSVLKELAQARGPNDQVYVHSGAGPAVDFYLREKERRFIYGKNHVDTPQEYVPELLASIDRNTDRIWLVFSHHYGSQDQGIVDSLQTGWDVQRVVAASGAALYVAHRRPFPALALVQP